MHAQHVGAAEELVLFGNALDVHLLKILRREERIVRGNVHAKRLRLGRKAAGNAAETIQAQRQILQARDWSRLGGIPDTFTQQTTQICGLAQQSQHQSNSVIRNLIKAVFLNVSDHNSTLCSGRNVDVVEAHAAADDDLALLQGVDELLIHFDEVFFPIFRPYKI